MELDPNQKSGEGCFLRTARALSGRKLSLTGSLPPMRGIAAHSREFSKSYQSLVAITSSDTELENPAELLSSLENTIYRASELFEAFKKAVDAVSATRKREHKGRVGSFTASHKSHRDFAAILCNHLKHHHNRIYLSIFVRMPIDRPVLAFMLCEPQGEDTFAINKRFHKDKERAVSLPMSIRRILYDVLSVDEAAARVFENLEDDCDVEFAKWDVSVANTDTMAAVRDLPYAAITNENRRYSFMEQDRCSFMKPDYPLECIDESWGFKLSITTEQNVRTYPLPIFEPDPSRLSSVIRN